ncbi:MAG: transporter substrate-binding domain-containing protein [Streptosporangiales bacterium]|nr:transporter substrate-binding domain-containing protein [Streptosporangiales bacterium]
MRTSVSGRPRRFAAALLAAVLATALTACGGSDSGSGSGGEGLERTTVRVASLPTVDAAALHVGVEQDIFSKAGLDVRIQPVQQSIQALPALVNGQVDVIASANYVTFLQAHDKGTLKLRVISEAIRIKPGVMSVRVMPDSPIRTPKDLEGKTVGVNILNNIQSLTLNAVLEEQGLDPTKVKYRQIPFPQMGAVLEKGEVDAVHVVEPFQAQLAGELGARAAVDGGQAPVTDLPISGYVTTEKFVTENPTTAAAFQKAMAEAQALADKDRTQVEKVLPGYAKIDAAAAKKLVMPAFPATVDAPGLQKLADMMTEAGLLTRRLDAATVVYSPR